MVPPGEEFSRDNAEPTKKSRESIRKSNASCNKSKKYDGKSTSSKGSLSSTTTEGKEETAELPDTPSRIHTPSPSSNNRGGIQVKAAPRERPPKLAPDKRKRDDAFMRTKVDPEANPKAKAKANPKAREKAIARANPKASEKANAKANPKASEKPNAKANPKASEKLNAKANPKTRGESKAKANSKASAKSNPKSSTVVNPETSDGTALNSLVCDTPIVKAKARAPPRRKAVADNEMVEPKAKAKARRRAPPKANVSIGEENATAKASYSVGAFVVIYFNLIIHGVTFNAVVLKFTLS